MEVDKKSGVDTFWRQIRRQCGRVLARDRVQTLQLNLGRRCNQACLHCHVEAGPDRTETMSEQVAERVLRLLSQSTTIETVDLTGGAPELNDVFRELVVESRALGKQVIDRCNLTILLEPGHEDLAEFLASNEVRIVASLPCYSKSNVDGQRGRGSFHRSLEALRHLNALGYGRSNPKLQLDLVYNPSGASLPPSQAELQSSYADELKDHDITFDDLLTITNVVIGRFAHQLSRDGQLEEYRETLRRAFNPATIDGLMCRSLLSVAYDGELFDCDFNQVLGLPAGCPKWGSTTIFDIESFDELVGRPIAVGDHCFACTAGSGSGCSGALVDQA